MTAMTPLDYWSLAALAFVAVAAYGLLALNLLAPRVSAWLARREERAEQRLAAEAEERRREEYRGKHSCDGPTERLEIAAVVAAIESAVAEVAA